MVCYHELKKKEERKMICYSELKGGRKEDGLLFWTVVKREKKMVCYFDLKGRKKGRWFVTTNWKEGRKEDGLLLRIERMAGWGSLTNG